MNAILTLSKQRPQNKASLVLFWQEWDVQEGDISLPNELEKELIALRTEHASFAFQLGQTTILGQSIADHFLASTPSMYWCSLIYERHPKMTPNLYTIYKLRLVEKFLDKKNIKHLTLIGHDDRLATVLKDLLAAKNRGFTYQKEGSPPPKEPFLKRFYHALPPILRTGIRFLHWLTTVKRKLPKRPLPIYDNTASIVTYFPNIDLNKAEKGRFYSHYWEELHTLLEKQPIRWLFVRFPSPQMHLDACIAFLRQAEKKALDGVSFSYIEEHLGCGDILHSLKTYFALRKTAKKLSTKIPSLFHFANSALNFWPYAKDDWEESFCGWRALERCIQNRGIQNYVQKAGPQRFYLYPLENCPWERMLTSHVHSQKAGPIYGAQHSTIRPTDFRYFDCEQSYQSNLPMPDLFLANGASAAKQWRDSGMPLDRLTTVTALRYRYLTALKAQSLTCYEKKTLLILTSFFLDETKAHLDLFNQAMALNLFTEYDLLIKPHPYLPVETMIQTKFKDKVRIVTGTISSYFKRNVLVWASNSTTAALEAAILNLPIAVMRPINDFDLSPIQNVPNLLRTATITDVQNMLAHAHPIVLPCDYLCLDDNLASWQKLLGICPEQ